MDAYKCDNCGQLLEGSAKKLQDFDLGQYVVRFSLARKEESKPEEERQQLQPHVEDGVMVLPMFREIPKSEDGMTLHFADMCDPCRLQLLKAALLKAQTDDIASSLFDAVAEIE